MSNLPPQGGDAMAQPGVTPTQGESSAASASTQAAFNPQVAGMPGMPQGMPQQPAPQEATPAPSEPVEEVLSDDAIIEQALIEQTELEAVANQADTVELAPILAQLKKLTGKTFNNLEGVANTIRHGDKLAAVAGEAIKKAEAVQAQAMQQTAVKSNAQEKYDATLEMIALKETNPNTEYVKEELVRTARELNVRPFEVWERNIGGIQRTAELISRDQKFLSEYKAKVSKPSQSVSSDAGEKKQSLATLLQEREARMAEFKRQNRSM